MKENRNVTWQLLKGVVLGLGGGCSFFLSMYMCVFMPVSVCVHVYMCVCVYEYVCTWACVYMCPCVCRSEADIAVSFHYALLYLLDRVSCWIGCFPVKQASLPRPRGSHLQPWSFTNVLQCPDNLYMSSGTQIQALTLEQQVCYPKEHLPNSQKSFYVIIISGEGACLSWHMCGYQRTTSWGWILPSTFNGLWGPNSGHQAGPASHRPISKTVLKNFMQSWAFWKSQYWDSGTCIGNVQSRPANGEYRYVQGMDWEPFPSQG